MWRIVLGDKSSLPNSYIILDFDTNYSDLILVVNNKLGSSVVISQGIAQLRTPEDKTRFGIELKQALSALRNEIPDARCEKIFLTGSADQQVSLVDSVLQKDFNLKAQYLSTKEYDNFVSSGLKDVSMSAVTGFSTQVNREDIRFIIPDLQIKKEMKAKVAQLMILGVSLIYILICLGGISLVRLIQQQFYSASLKAKVEILSKDAKELDDITNKLKIAKQYVDPKSSVLTFLYELNRMCPDSITITNYSWEFQKNFSFRGYAQQIPDILAFTNTLSSSDIFKGAQNRYTRRRKLKDKDVVDFEIIVK